MSKNAIGWTFVAVQAALTLVLVVVPGADHWPTPRWLRHLGFALVAGGVATMLLAAFGLGRGLTPTPVPTDSGQLITSGLYRHVRHPIYTGVLAVVIGLVVRSGSLVTLAVGLLAVVFFNVKARWEEGRLAERYPDYPDYVRRTPRFVPWRW